MPHVTSADGTRIAHSIDGSGPKGGSIPPFEPLTRSRIRSPAACGRRSPGRAMWWTGP